MSDSNAPANDASELFTSLSLEELNELDRVLREIADDSGRDQNNDETGIYCIAEFDGFVTALISGPTVVSPTVWARKILGNPDDVATTLTPEKLDRLQHNQERFIELAFRHSNAIADALTRNNQYFEPIFYEKKVAEDVMFSIVEEWCFGYTKGVELAGDWKDLSPDAQTLLDVIRLHGTHEGFSTLEQMSLDEERVSTEKVEPAALALHEYWYSRREPTAKTNRLSNLPPTQIPVVRDGPKRGRNDPCVCGSGKKFKKCCMGATPSN